VRLGRYWRTRPLTLVRAPLPGAAGAGEEDAVGEIGRELVMAGHLGALIPGETLSGLLRKLTEDGDKGIAHVAGRVSLRQRDQPEIAGASVDQGSDGGLVAGAHDKVSLPVAEALAQLDDRWPAVDEDGGRNESRHTLVGAATLLPQRPAGAELPGQSPAQAALRALVERSVDRLVAQVPLWLVGPAGAQVGGDLLGAPLQIQLAAPRPSAAGPRPAWRAWGVRLVHGSGDAPGQRHICRSRAGGCCAAAPG
jgi:hypothetical protein